MLVVFEKGNISYIKNNAMSKALKLVAMKIAYLKIKVMEINKINTHFLRSRGQMHLT